MDMGTIADQLSPNVRVALNHREQRLIIRPRIIFDYELLYLTRGKLLITIEGEQYTLFPGEMVLFRPGKEHEFTNIGEEEAWMPHIHFDPVFYEGWENVPINFKPLKDCTASEISYLRPDILGSEGLGIPYIIRITNHKEVLDILMTLIHNHEKKEPYYRLINKHLTLKILMLIIKGLQAQTQPSLSRHQHNLENAANYIIKHYNEKIMLEDLAKLCCLSIYHFGRLFKARYHLTPTEYQMRYRIEKAKEMILYSPLSLSEIANKIGYGSVQSFSKAFKKIEGISPSEYIERGRTF